MWWLRSASFHLHLWLRNMCPLWTLLIRRTSPVPYKNTRDHNNLSNGENKNDARSQDVAALLAEEIKDALDAGIKAYFEQLFSCHFAYCVCAFVVWQSLCRAPVDTSTLGLHLKVKDHLTARRHHTHKLLEELRAWNSIFRHFKMAPRGNAAASEHYRLRKWYLFNSRKTKSHYLRLLKAPRAPCPKTGPSFSPRQPLRLFFDIPETAEII